MEKPHVTVAKRHVATETDDRPLFNAAYAAWLRVAGQKM